MDTSKRVASLHRHVQSSLEDAGLTRDKLLVVAVSGGPDSLALLYALGHLRCDLGLRLHGAHLDHGLRGEASRSDAETVASHFRSLGIDSTAEKADVSSFREAHGLSPEEAARDVRYSFLGRVARERDADAVALGHTADDQAETVLMHIIRGSGLGGLRGMAALARRSIGGGDVVLVRPLLGSTREATEAYCRAAGLKPCFDESNLSPDITRNRVRMELLPLLEEYNPEVRDALVRLSRVASRDLSYIERQSDPIWNDVARAEGTGVTLDRAAFLALDAALQGHLLRRAFAALRGDLNNLRQYHVDTMVHLMAGPAGTSLDLPASIRFSVGYGEAVLTSRDQETLPIPPFHGEHRLHVPGETLVPGWRIVATVQEPESAGTSGVDGTIASVAAGGSTSTSTALFPQGTEAYLDEDVLGGHLWVRPRRPGDRFQPSGMTQPKKVQDFMVDSKIPRSWRDHVPLVVSSRGIAWVVGWRTADWARSGVNARRKLHVSFMPR